MLGVAQSFVADVGKENWHYLAKRTSAQILDFFHALEYQAGPAGLDH